MKNKYSKEYSEETLWNKIATFAKKAGKEVIEKTLTLFESLNDKDTPAWAKGVIIGALGYFISPIDAIPDVIPFAGFSDDLVVLGVAWAAVALYVKDEHIRKAQERISWWFGEGAQGDLVQLG